MNLLDTPLPVDTRSGPSGRIDGVVVGIVTNNDDPDNLGRVKVKLPWLSDNQESGWARIAAPMAGSQRGFCFLPEVDDEVLVAFEHGDVRLPYVLGALWIGKDKPPEPGMTKDGNVVMRVIKSRSGHLIRLIDEAGKEKIEIVDKTGENAVVIDSANGTVTVTANKDLVLTSTNGAIKLKAQRIEAESAGNASLKAEGNVEVKATAKFDLNAGASMTIKGTVVNIN